MASIGRLTTKSVGEFNPNDWLAEGHSLLLASRTMRAQWLVERRKLLKYPNEVQENKVGSFIRLSTIDRALPKASILLMGYAIEMYLKSSLARLLSGCAEDLFIHLSRNKFGHRYTKLAKFIDFPLATTDEKLLKDLERAVLSDARYPIQVKDGEDYIENLNKVRRSVTDRSTYRSYCKLAKRLFLHSRRIGGTPESMVIRESFTIDSDGYFSMRAGGEVSTRITYKLSSEMKQHGDPIALLRDNLDGISPISASLWNEATFWEHGLEDGKITFKKLNK